MSSGIFYSFWTSNLLTPEEQIAFRYYFLKTLQSSLSELPAVFSYTVLCCWISNKKKILLINEPIRNFLNKQKAPFSLMYKGILFITISHVSLFFTQATAIPYLLYENECIPITSGAEDEHFSKRQKESLCCPVVCVDM